MTIPLRVSQELTPRTTLLYSVGLPAPPQDYLNRNRELSRGEEIRSYLGFSGWWIFSPHPVSKDYADQAQMLCSEKFELRCSEWGPEGKVVVNPYYKFFLHEGLLEDLA